MATDQLEGRNVVLEALVRGRRRVLEVALDERAKPDAKVTAILEEARRRGVKVRRVPRQQLDRRSQTGTHNGVIAMAEPLPQLTVKSLLDEVPSPFVVAVDEVQYEHNVGAILRSCLGAGVDAMVVPVKRGRGLSPVVQRVAMGGAEAVPLIREGISSALSTARRAGLIVVGADQGGTPYWDLDLTGPMVLVLGGEDKGLSPALRKKCNAIASIPLKGDLDSLNVSVAAGILLFERQRQRAMG